MLPHSSFILIRYDLTKEFDFQEGFPELTLNRKNEKRKNESDEFVSTNNLLSITFYPSYNKGMDFLILELRFPNKKFRDTWFNALEHAKHTKRRLLSRSIGSDRNYLMKAFKEAMKNNKKPTLDENDFLNSYGNVLQRPDILNIFDEITKTYKGIAITSKELKNFFNKEQGHSVYIKECKDIIKAHIENYNNDHDNIGPKDFIKLFNSSSYFSIHNGTKSKLVYHNMTFPLSRYWINTSHNTYLTGNQITSNSAITGYINALKSGCRCVEVIQFLDLTGALEMLIEIATLFS